MADTTTQPPVQWYTRGSQGLQQEAARQDNQSSVKWFEVKQDGEKFAVFLGDESFNAYFHEYRQGKEFGLRCTCINGVHDDAVCCAQLGPRSRSFISLYTVIDIEGYKPKNKPAVPFALVPLGAKFGSAKLIEEERKAATSLIGRKVRITRTGHNAPRSGNAFRSVQWASKTGGPPADYLNDAGWAGLAKVVTYRGKKLADSIRAVNEAVLKGDFTKRDAMARVFLIDGLLQPDGTVQEGLIPSFNFLSMYAPLSPRELRAQLTGATVDDFGDRDAAAAGAGGGADKGFGGGGTAGPSAPRADDDIPF